LGRHYLIERLPAPITRREMARCTVMSPGRSGGIEDGVGRGPARLDRLHRYHPDFAA
jgi:hypothetical protein